MLRIASLLLACLVLLAAPAAGSEPVDRRSAFVLGDSLALGTFPHLPALLPEWSLTRHALVGYRTAAGAQRLRSLGDRLPPNVLLSLGTNDDPRRLEEFRRDVRSILATAGRRRCVVWANIARPPVAGVSYDRFNRVLAREALLHRQLRIVDWWAMTRSHPEWLRRDRVHATPAGYRARAAASVRALGGCPVP